ncbi:hypothetical protein GLOIN_2v326605 [Rhizophagus irregularis DAOM 181602=DAOM 197198]|uniref:Uncharacterized protein n=1 Tax=Rhizophagus irregularis (strain DAOM 181602 / DAOM 197198 / MUCL 43194) TaxID=747089 RepID=A0A2P4PNH6_RHIID|nr:hypothetical protein GLOIN_2v326605 [Rhizophagus irregularis DAOM 181602=DAOM 197198]POG66938.1 hypothetical protein GLOIN_2v326605 [Rhizophagus irregularis DAOM 181602=DAOM 197198]CAG8674361.1 9862_t:CDS:2 [Rhizophagus irregularis]|eukprot:XP_025173804.1 hypothetical protein GLOIN_2v326605 [Rhizophagus irregularis DAOM 181602=DAOM 197198]
MKNTMNLNSIATKINDQHGTNFNGYQCKEKFANLIRDYNWQSKGEKKPNIDGFRTHFWKRPEDPFDRIRNMNISNRGRSRRSSLLTPSIEEVEQVLGQRSSSQRSRRSRSNRRSCTRSESLSRNLFQTPSMPCNEDGDTGNCWREHSDFIYPTTIL